MQVRSRTKAVSRVDHYQPVSSTRFPGSDVGAYIGSLCIMHEIPNSQVFSSGSAQKLGSNVYEFQRVIDNSSYKTQSYVHQWPEANNERLLECQSDKLKFLPHLVMLLVSTSLAS